MMKILKNAAAALSLAVAVSAVPLYPASAIVAENQKYAANAGSITEDFETLTAEELTAGNSSIVRGFTNSTTATVNSLASGSGNYLSFQPNGAADTSMLTKTGLFKYDVTVVDVYLRCTEPTAANNNCAVITLKDEANNNNTLPLVDFAYTANGAKLRNRLDTSKTLAWAAGKWLPVRFIFNRTAQTITIKAMGVPSFAASKELTWKPDDKTYLQFQAVGSNTLSIDDITISDGFYLEDDYINEDFEHITNMTANVSILGLKGSGANYQASADEKNTYLSVVATSDGGAFLNNSNTSIILTAGKPTVISFRLKTDKTTNITPRLRHNSGNTIPFTITNGIVSFVSKTRDVTDGAFHTYRMCITPKVGTNGFTASLMIDNVWLGTQDNSATNLTSQGGRFDFVLSKKDDTVELDDFHIFYAETPKLRGKFENTNVGIDSALTIEGNNPMNYSTVTSSAFTLTEDDTGNTVPIKTPGAADFVTRNNTFALSFAEALKPNTNYTLSVADNALRDMYDQYYSGTIATFTTGEEPKTQYSLTYKVNGQEASDTACLAAGKLDVTLNVQAYSEGANALAVTALYDASDNLIRALPMSSILSGADTDTQTISLTISEEELSGAKVKLFLWNGATYAPIQEEVTVLTPAAN